MDKIVKFSDPMVVSIVEKMQSGDASWVPGFVEFFSSKMQVAEEKETAFEIIRWFFPAEKTNYSQEEKAAMRDYILGASMYSLSEDFFWRFNAAKEVAAYKAQPWQRKLRHPLRCLDMLTKNVSCAGSLMTFAAVAAEVYVREGGDRKEFITMLGL